MIYFNSILLSTFLQLRKKSGAKTFFIILLFYNFVRKVDKKSGLEQKCKLTNSSVSNRV